jgi:hypothetical protein
MIDSQPIDFIVSCNLANEHCHVPWAQGSGVQIAPPRPIENKCFICNARFWPALAQLFAICGFLELPRETLKWK